MEHRNVMQRIPIVATVFALAAGVYGFVLQHQRASSEDQTRSTTTSGNTNAASRVSVHSSPLAEDQVGRKITYLTQSLTQIVRIERMEALGEANVILVENSEKGEFAGQRARFERSRVTSLPVLDVAPRFYNDFIVILAKDASLEVERWIFEDKTGARSASMPATTAPIGTAVATPLHQNFVVGGGPWLPLEQRSPKEPREVRKHLASISNSGTLHASGVDPDGRYYLLLIDATVFQYALSPNGPLLATFDLSQIGLADGSNLGDLRAVDVPNLGRVMYSEAIWWPNGSGLDLALVDSNNDGVFDGGIVAVPRTSHNFANSPNEFDDDDGGPVLSLATRNYGF